MYIFVCVYQYAYQYTHTHTDLLCFERRVIAWFFWICLDAISMAKEKPTPEFFHN